MTHSHGHSAVLRGMPVFSAVSLGYRLTQAWLEAFKVRHDFSFCDRFKSFGQGNGYPRIQRGHSLGILHRDKARQRETVGRASGVGHLGFTGTPFGST